MLNIDRIYCSKSKSIRLKKKKNKSLKKFYRSSMIGKLYKGFKPGKLFKPLTPIERNAIYGCEMYVACAKTKKDIIYTKLP